MTQTASVHSRVLDYLGQVKLPEKRGEMSLDWGQESALAAVKSGRLATHDFCPCECLTAASGFDLEIQHHDGLFGVASGPAGTAFANALANQGDGYNNMQALVGPNLPPPIRAMIITKVGTFSMHRVLQLWGAAQEGFGRAIADAWDNGWFPAGYNRSHVLVAGIFIHPFAGLVPPTEPNGKFDKKKVLEGSALENSMHALYCLTYLAGIGMLSDALTGGLTVEERCERAKKTKHPFRGFTPVDAAATPPA